MNRAKIFIAFTFLLAFAVCVSAQSVQFPNELKGYEFFGNGRLKDLRIGISSKENVIKIFGEDCSKLCDYDDNWNIKFHYFNNWTRTNGRQKYISSPEFAGKLWLVEMFPKKIIAFSEITFSDLFKQSQGIVVGGGLKSALKDAHGLSYLFESEITIGQTKFGNLLATRYDVSKEIDKKAWIIVHQKDDIQK